MLTNSMAIKLIDFYGKDTKNEVKRNRVKIIVDSLIEQLCNSFLDSKPDGIANVRRKVNLIILEKVGSDKEILTKFGKILRSYTDAFSKSYIDHTYNFNSFLNEDLKEFILVLIKYNYIEDIQLRTQLRELLS